MRNNTKASTLVVALSLMVLFTGLGLGALNYSSTQSQTTISQMLKTQAFWVADAGLQAVCASGIAPTGNTSLVGGGNGTYNVTPHGAVSVGGATLTSAGTTSWSQITLSHVLQATCTLSPFNYGLYSPTLTGLPNPPPGPPGPTPAQLTINSYNSNTGVIGGTTAYNAIATSVATSSTALSQRGINISPNGSIEQINISLPSITIPSALQSALCPTTGSSTGPNTASWNVTTSTIFPGAGNYQCSSLLISTGQTLTIDTNVNLYLTSAATDFNSLGVIKIVPGGSLTVYANGQMAFSAGTMNNTTLVPSDFIIYSLYSSTGNAVSISDVLGTISFYGLVYAPQGTISLSASQVVYGSLVANNVAIAGNNSTLYYDQALSTLGGISNWSELS